MRTVGWKVEATGAMADRSRQMPIRCFAQSIALSTKEPCIATTPMSWDTRTDPGCWSLSSWSLSSFPG